MTQKTQNNLKRLKGKPEETNKIKLKKSTSIKEYTSEEIDKILNEALLELYEIFKNAVLKFDKEGGNDESF